MPYEIAPTTSFPTEAHAQEHLEGLIEDGHDEDEMKEFIETHGAKDFVCYFEDYARMVDEYDQETVDAFLEEFDLMDVEHLNDAYHGRFDSEAEFAENFLNDCYGMPDMPYWVAIDWEKTWDDGLSWDYTFNNGYVFCNNWQYASLESGTLGVA